MQKAPPRKVWSGISPPPLPLRPSTRPISPPRTKSAIVRSAFAFFVGIKYSDAVFVENTKHENTLEILRQKTHVFSKFAFSTNTVSEFDAHAAGSMRRGAQMKPPTKKTRNMRKHRKPAPTGGSYAHARPFLLVN
jgi:hypothetical protein